MPGPAAVRRVGLPFPRGPVLGSSWKDVIVERQLPSGPLSSRDSVTSRDLAYDFDRPHTDSVQAARDAFVRRQWNTLGENNGESFRRALEVCEAAFDDIVDKSADGVVVVN